MKYTNYTKLIASAIHIQPNDINPRTMNPHGFSLTFPLLFQGMRSIHPETGGKTYMQAFKRAQTWQRRLNKVLNKRIPIVLNDCRYSWPQYNQQKNIRYTLVG